MDQNSRFYGCESLGFPAVSNYDYTTNIPTRGVANRDFRWEEVAVESTYLLKEATLSGSFESNTFSATVTNATGINYITTGGIPNTGGYPGWTLSGSRTIYIGTSGVFVNSGDLPSVTSSFQAHPIDGNQAVGLFCHSGIPYITSVEYRTGSEGPIILDGRHQLYLQAKLNYGGTGVLHAFVRAKLGGAVVGYYDHVAGSWGASAPTGYFTLSGNLQTIKYDFTCSSWPSSTPDGLDIVIYSSRTGSFVTVDNIHLDAYFKRNAFVDFLVPSGYFIQVTPDLGWHNIQDMFDGGSALPNPHLRTIGPFQVDLGNLTDNLDNTVTATIDESDFSSAITNSYSNYLWRALPITENGQLGIGGLPDRFEYIGRKVDDLFKITEVSEDTTSPIRVVFGTKSKDMIVVVDDNEAHPNITYPTETSWKLELSIHAPVKVVKIFAKDKGGSTSTVRYIELKNTSYSQNESKLWNVFDEHGLAADIERLPKESNYEYSLRIKDVYKNKGGPFFRGIVNGATRELGLVKVQDGLIIKLKKDVNGVLYIKDLSVNITAYSIQLIHSSLYSTETLTIDPVYGTLDLARPIYDVPEAIYTTDGKKIDGTDIKIVENENKDKHQLYINDITCYGKKVTVKYRYYIEYLFKHYKGLEDLYTALNNTQISNHNPIECKISSLLSGNEKSLGLFIGSYELTDNQISIPWSPIVIKKISDRGYRDYFKTTDTETVPNTEYYKYIRELKNNTRIFWGAVEADRDRWGSYESKNLSMDSIPTLWDPPLTRIVDTLSGISDATEAWGKDFRSSNGSLVRMAGLSSNIFSPGVAHKNDLKPDIYYTTSYIKQTESIPSNVGSVKNNNAIIVFSGQR